MKYKLITDWSEVKDFLLNPESRYKYLAKPESTTKEKPHEINHRR